MARRPRPVRFDDKNRPELKRLIPPTDPKYPAVRRRLNVTFGKTLLGYAGMGALCAFTLWIFGFAFNWQSIWSIIGWSGLFWFGLPVVMWWFCAQIALKLQKAVPADPNNPDHARVQRCVDIAFADSGMKYKPPLYASPDKMPNAFATGPIHRKAVVAFTAGLLDIGLTDEEITAVFAHELGHVRNYDVALNSITSLFSMFFFLTINAGVMSVLGGIGWARKFFKIGEGGIVANLMQNLLLLPIFWLTSQLTMVLMMFVVRSRESGADATGAYITGNPCALATALQKLADYVKKHRPKSFTQEFALYQVMRPMMIIDPLFDSNDPQPEALSLWQRIKAFWQYLKLTHPPVPERVEELERMNGGSCPRI